MPAPKFPDLCPSCSFENEPALCESCEEGSNYDPADGDGGIDELREINFYPSWKDAA